MYISIPFGALFSFKCITPSPLKHFQYMFIQRPEGLPWDSFVLSLIALAPLRAVFHDHQLSGGQEEIHPRALSEFLGQYVIAVKVPGTVLSAAVRFKIWPLQGLYGTGAILVTVFISQSSSPVGTRSGIPGRCGRSTNPLEESAYDLGAGSGKAPPPSPCSLIK